jgi:arylformamidase
MKYYDVSTPIHPGMPVFKGDPSFDISLSSSIEKGDSANVSILHMGTHTGTHIDAPRHFINNGKTVDRIPLEILIGPAHVVEIRGVSEISRDVISNMNLQGKERVLFKTSNSSLWRETSFREDFAYLTECATRYLVEIGAKLVGIDYLSVERFGAEKPLAHTTLLQEEIVILEGLDLSAILPGQYKLICLPLLLKDADGSPCRAILVKE